MKEISLIVTSRGNTKDLKRLFESISKQEKKILKKLEVIFADQNDDQLLVEQFSDKIDINYKSIEPSSLSSARNQVLNHAKGRIVGFPDDDCWYPPKFFIDVFNFFKNYPNYSMWVCNIKDPNRNLYYGSRPTSKESLNDKNIYYLPSSVSMFINRNVIKDEDIIFNELLGVGSQWGSGEDVELAFNIYKKYSDCVYDGTKSVYHPVITDTTLDKAKKYGEGSGALAALLFINKNYKHLIIYAEYVLRNLLGGIYYLFRFNFDKSSVYLARFRGLLNGLLKGYYFFK